MRSRAGHRCLQLPEQPSYLFGLAKVGFEKNGFGTLTLKLKFDAPAVILISANKERS